MKNRRGREIPPNSKDKQDKIVDLTGLKPAKKRNTVRSGLGDTSGLSTNNDMMFFTVPDHKGLEDEHEDEYEKYNQMFDGFADQQLINSNATIIHSEITLTDSHGHNRTLVRRDPNSGNGLNI